MSEQPLCEICGEPMPESEQMFKYHGSSGPCPKPPLPRAPSDKEMLDWLQARAEEGCVTMCFELDGGVHVTLDPCGGEPCAAREAETVRDGIAALMRPNTQVQPRREAASAEGLGMGNPVPADFKPNYSISCEACGAAPTIDIFVANKLAQHTELCGPCTWGEADTLDQENW